MGILERWSDLPLTPHYGSDWLHKIADFDCWAFISIIIALGVLSVLGGQVLAFYYLPKGGRL